MSRTFATRTAPLFLLFLALNAAAAKADTITFGVFSPGPFGHAVSAGATVTVSENMVRITLSNGLGNPVGINQALSGFAFTLSTGQKSGSLLSSSGLEHVIGVNSSTNNGVVTTNWILQSNVGDGLQLCVACGAAGPAHTILYSNYVTTFLDSTIAGSAVNNPFLVGPVTFDISVAGLPSTAYISTATFIFGTDVKKMVTIHPPDPIPEPATLLLLGTGIAGVAARLRRKKKASENSLRVG